MSLMQMSPSKQSSRTQALGLPVALLGRLLVSPSLILPWIFANF